MADTIERAAPPKPDSVINSVEQYSAVIAQTFGPLVVTAGRGSPFHARLRRDRYSSLTIAQVHCSATQVRHITRKGAEDDSANRLLKVMVQLEGSGILALGKRQAKATPGTMIAYDNSQDYTLAFRHDYKAIVMSMPFSAMGGRATMIAERMHRTVAAPPGIGPLVSNMFRGPVQVEMGYASPGRALFADALVSLMAAAFIGDGVPDNDTDTAFHEQVLAFCEANLADPRLSLPFVAAALHVSVSYMQKRLQSNGIALASWIRQQRVRRIADDLRNPDYADLTVCVVAQRWGILDTSHLSRILRTHTGMSAKEIRHERTGFARA
jgi:AraC-like DNA-binding protein